MELRVQPRVESRDTMEFLPTINVVDVPRFQGDDDSTSDKQVKYSLLPYYIARHRKMADKCFEHARSKEHGLKHLDIRKGGLALFWIVVFLFVMGICFSMITDLVRAYLSVPVATQIKAERDVFEFPDVSICAKSPFYTDISHDTTSASLDNLLQQIQNSVTQKMADASVKVTTAGIQSALLIQMATRQDDTLLRAYQHIIYCRYDDMECSFYNFTELVHLRYVQCFTFSPKNRMVSGGKGLQLIFYKQRHNKKPFVMLNDLENPNLFSSIFATKDSAFSDDANDGIHILVHNPLTFPTYEISSMPTSFSLRYGQQATVEVFGLKYRSDMTGRKSCIVSKAPYKYKNFRGGANFLEYQYTYEDCVANMKQNYFLNECGCNSDRLFVPFREVKTGLDRANLSSTEFCRDMRQKTSQRIREDFLCFDQYDRMPTTTVLDKYIPMNLLYETREDLDARKIERHAVCSLPCEKTIYATRFFELVDMDEGTTFPPTLLATYIQQLESSQLKHDMVQRIWDKMVADSKISLKDKLENVTETNDPPISNEVSAQDMVILDVRTSTELIDAWEEEVTESLFNLISNLGGTLGLCAGISFLSSFFLLIFFGRAFVHALLSVVLWFWWAVYLGRPPAAVPERSTEEVEELDATSTPESFSSSFGAPSPPKHDDEHYGGVQWKVLQSPDRNTDPGSGQVESMYRNLNVHGPAGQTKVDSSEVPDSLPVSTRPQLPIEKPILIGHKSNVGVRTADKPLFERTDEGQQSDTVSQLSPTDIPEYVSYAPKKNESVLQMLFDPVETSKPLRQHSSHVLMYAQLPPVNVTGNQIPKAGMREHSRPMTAPFAQPQENMDKKEPSHHLPGKINNLTESPALELNNSPQEIERNMSSSSGSQRPSSIKSGRNQGDLKSLSKTIAESNCVTGTEDHQAMHPPKTSPKLGVTRIRSPERIPPTKSRRRSSSYRRRSNIQRMEKVPAEKDSSDFDKPPVRSRPFRPRYPPPIMLRHLGPIISDNISTQSLTSASEKEHNNIESSRSVQDNSTLNTPVPPTNDSVVLMDTDESPPYFYDYPPPVVVRQQFDLNPNYKIYVPEEDTYTNQFIPSLIDQERIPRYLHARYGDPPPYCTLWK